MGFTVNPGNVNNVPADTYLAHEGDKLEYVFMILKGRAGLENGACCINCGAGTFVGINDLDEGYFSSSVYFKEEASVYAFPVKTGDAPAQILKAKKDYSGFAVWTLARIISDYDRLEHDLEIKAKELSDSIKADYDEYIKQTKAAGFLGEFKLIERMKEFEPTGIVDDNLLTYYNEVAKQPVDNCKLFFAESPLMGERHVREESILMGMMQERCTGTAQFIEEAVYVLFNKGQESLYAKCAEHIGRLKSLNKDTSDAQKLLEKVKDLVLESIIFFEQNMHHKLKVDIEQLEEAYAAVLEGRVAENVEESAVPDAEAVSILRKSISHGAKILTDYAGWDKERATSFIDNIEAFVNVKNRMSADESLRHLKREISKAFFPLYMDVFLKQTGEKEVPQVVDLFLNFGFVDDRLLSDDRLADLCSIKADKPSAPCQVYTMREWLNLVYEMRRTPSKSEMDMDFEDSLRDRKKRGEITEVQMASIAKDPVQWLAYEVQNMFTSNERLLNGQVTTFTPVLYDEGMAGMPSRMRITKDRVNTMVQLLMVNDPTVFHREIIYSNAEQKIEREAIMKRVYPEFILFPVSGSNVLMWQETSSRKRDSAGRILLPMFFEGSAEDAMLRALGRFRWELCKTIQGLSWNNIQVKSLTSEYFDYVTYYRKNHDLSDERKEKLKAQITKARNNIREVFVQDYESWIKYEATGAVRLNKFVREILATYIPFSKTVRTGLEAQPVFGDAYARFERNLKKKQYDLDLHYKNLEKNGIPLSAELKLTKEFYNNI